MTHEWTMICPTSGDQIFRNAICNCFINNEGCPKSLLIESLAQCIETILIAASVYETTSELSKQQKAVKGKTPSFGVWANKAAFNTACNSKDMST